MNDIFSLLLDQLFTVAIVYQIIIFFIFIFLFLFYFLLIRNIFLTIFLLITLYIRWLLFIFVLYLDNVLQILVVQTLKVLSIRLKKLFAPFVFFINQHWRDTFYFDDQYFDQLLQITVLFLIEELNQIIINQQYLLDMIDIIIYNVLIVRINVLLNT